MNKLIFGNGNAKLHKGIATFSLPSGFTCPGALNCLSFANRFNGKIKDGNKTTFRCFSASQEALFPRVRKARWNNFDLLKGKTINEMATIIQESLPKQKIIRMHVAGDFFSQDYFDAWLVVAHNNSDKIFYAYTKSLNFWIARKDVIPSNFKLNASYGGKFDNNIKRNRLKNVKVVFSVKEAGKKEIDHDDSHAYKSNRSFALLLHGTQPKGSIASKMLSALRVEGIGSYGKGNK